LTTANSLDRLRTKATGLLASTGRWLNTLFLSVPIRAKIIGMVLLPVIILGVVLNYWIRSSLSDWLSWLLNSERVDAAMAAGGRSVLLVTLLVAVFSIMISLVLMLLLTTPILELKQTADRVRRGELKIRAPVRTKDEIGQVADSFNRMIDQLLESQREIEESSRRFKALSEVYKSVGRGLDLHAILDAALDTTLAVMNLDQGWIYLLEPETKRYYVTSAVGSPASLPQHQAIGQESICNCLGDFNSSSDWPGPQLRRCEYLQGQQPDGHSLSGISHISIPLRAQGIRLGMLNMIWNKDQDLSKEETNLLQAMGVQMSEAILNARMHSDLRQKEAGMEHLLNALVHAQEDERNRISIELHDDSGQELTSILLRLKALEQKEDISDIRYGVSEMCAELSHAIEHIRELSHRLRPPDLEPLGLGPTLHSLVKDMLADSPIEFNYTSEMAVERMDPSIEITLYRIAQEGLTNILRHSRANHAEVTLISDDREVALQILDDGVGFDLDQIANSDKIHIGLASIQERVETLGGILEVYTAPNAGTRLSVRIPLLKAEYA
jgi:signal transduction histidine kinase